GLRHLKAIHANDAKKPLGCRVDRHEHIGQGEIGREAFARIVTDPRLRCIPIIIETPDSDTMHPVNLSLLQQLATGEAATLTVTVQLFGHYSDIAGTEPLQLSVRGGATVRDVAQMLADRDS